MKYVHLTSVHPRYDTRIFLKECRALAAAGHEVSLIVADGRGGERRDEVAIVDVGAGKGRRLGGGKKVIFDAHEDLPRQILSKPWIPAPVRGPVSRGAEWVEDYVARRVDGVVAATPHIRDRFLKLNPHTVDINNYPMPEELAPAAGEHVRKRQICYVGGITQVRGIEPLIRALPLVPDVTLVLGGRFSEPEFEASMRALPGWGQVDYRGFMDRDAVRQVLSESMAGIVTFLPAPNHTDAQPNKMFEYMAAELPVIASDFPLWRQIVDGAGAGLCVDPESSEAIAAAVGELLENSDMVAKMGQAGRRAVLEQYNWPNEARKLVDFYEGLECGCPSVG